MEEVEHMPHTSCGISRIRKHIQLRDQKTITDRHQNARKQGSTVAHDDTENVGGTELPEIPHVHVVSMAKRGLRVATSLIREYEYFTKLSRVFVA